LDLAEGTYSALSHSASEDFGRYLLEGTPSAPLARVLGAKRWLDTDGGDASRSPKRPQRKRHGRWAHPLVCLPVVGFMLRTKGLAACLDWAQSFEPTSPSAPLSRALRSFSRVAAFLTSSKGDADCLPRSLALFVFLRSRGFTPELVIGVKRFPFGAHAWVEHAGVPVLEERPEHLGRFSEILRTA
jgi:hypothetical protein